VALDLAARIARRQGAGARAGEGASRASASTRSAPFRAAAAPGPPTRTTTSRTPRTRASERASRGERAITVPLLRRVTRGTMTRMRARAARRRRPASVRPRTFLGSATSVLMPRPRSVPSRSRLRERAPAASTSIAQSDRGRAGAERVGAAAAAPPIAPHMRALATKLARQSVRPLTNPPVGEEPRTRCTASTCFPYRRMRTFSSIAGTGEV
jgi:hypothetical protein